MERSQSGRAMPRPAGDERTPLGLVPPDPRDVDDMRSRIEAHKATCELEAASSTAFRLECENAHDDITRVTSQLEQQRRERHARHLEAMEVTYARARVAKIAVTPETLALKRLARDIIRRVEAAEARDENIEQGDSNKKGNRTHKNLSPDAIASDRFVVAALELASETSQQKACDMYQQRLTNDMCTRCVALKESHLHETNCLAKKSAEAEQVFLKKKTRAFSDRFVRNKTVKTVKSTSLHTSVKSAASFAVNNVTRVASQLASESNVASEKHKRGAVAFYRKLARSQNSRTGNDLKTSTPVVFADEFGSIDWTQVTWSDSREHSERALRVERTARVKWSRLNTHTKENTEKKSSSENKKTKDTLRAGVLVFHPDNLRLNTHRGLEIGTQKGYVNDRIDEDDEPFDSGNNSVENAVENDDDDDDDDDEYHSSDKYSYKFHQTHSFAAPSNSSRRGFSRARLGEARVVALGHRGDDMKGFGVLGDTRVCFADRWPAGRVGQDMRYESDGDAPGDEAMDDGVCDDTSSSDDETNETVNETVESNDCFPVGFGVARWAGSGMTLPNPPDNIPVSTNEPSLSRVIHDRRVAASRARGVLTTIREARKGMAVGKWR